MLTLANVMDFSGFSLYDASVITFSKTQLLGQGCGSFVRVSAVCRGPWDCVSAPHELDMGMRACEPRIWDVRRREQEGQQFKVMLSQWL